MQWWKWRHKWEGKLLSKWKKKVRCWCAYVKVECQQYLRTYSQIWRLTNIRDRLEALVSDSRFSVIFTNLSDCLKFTFWLFGCFVDLDLTKMLIICSCGFTYVFLFPWKNFHSTLQRQTPVKHIFSMANTRFSWTNTRLGYMLETEPNNPSVWWRSSSHYLWGPASSSRWSIKVIQFIMK